MKLEFDTEKSATNRAKHGIDFVQAQDLWDDPDRVEVSARTIGEPRWLVVGCISDVHWSAVITYRDRRVRIISVRRSRSEEVKIFAEDEH